MRPEILYEWTAIFLLYTEPGMNGDQEKELDLILNDIRNCAFNDRSKLLIIYRRIKCYKLYNYEVTYLFEVKTNVLQSKDKPIFHLIKTERVPNYLLSGDGLSKMLETCREFSSEKTLLFIWGHGAIFGIFKKKMNSIILRGTVPVSNVRTPDIEDMLTNEELRDAIKNGLGQKLDMLIMINCLMQNVMTQYALEGVVKYLVAPQSAMGLPGYNYGAILQTIFSGNTTAADVATVALTTFKEKWVGNPDYLDRIETWSVAAFDLDQLCKLKPFLQKFGNYLSDCLAINPSLKGAIDNSVRSKLFEFDDTPRNPVSNLMVDLGLLIFRLKTMDESAFGGCYTQLVTILEAMQVLAPFIGNNIYYGILPLEQPLPFGLCIYFPFTRRNAAGDFTFPLFVSGQLAKTTSTFFLDEYWYRMLHYYWRVPLASACEKIA